MHLPLSKSEVDRILDNNLVDEFDRLAGTPGFVLVPMLFQKVYLAVSHRLQDTSNTFRCKYANTTVQTTGAKACQGGNFGLPWTAWSPPWTHQNLQNVQKQGMTFDCYCCLQAVAEFYNSM